MAPRLATSNDLATIRNQWDIYRASLPEYVADAIAASDAQRWLNDPDVFLCIDPATTTAAVFIAKPPITVEMRLAFTNLVGTGSAAARALQQRAAMDVMMLFGFNGALNRGATRAYGTKIFNQGFDWANTKAVKYFGGLPTCVTLSKIMPDSKVQVSIISEDLAGMIAGIQARQ